MLLTWTGNWWALALRAVAAILLGIIAFAIPGPTLGAIVVLFGVYAVIDGVLALVAAGRGLHRHERLGVMLWKGITGIAAGGIALAWPGIGVLALVYLMAAWALVSGVLEIAFAVRLRRVIRDEWLLILSGEVSVLFAIVVAALPAAGATGLVWTIGVYALLYGVIVLALSFRLREWTRANPLPLGEGAPQK